MTVKFSDIKKEDDFNKLSEDTVIVIDDRPPRYIPETFERVLPGDARYDVLPDFDRATGKFIYNN